MKRNLLSAASRAVVTALVICSWFVLSNHCALGLMQATSTSAEHGGCCGKEDSKGGGEAPGSLVRECCQFLQAVTPAAVVVAPPTNPVELVQLATFFTIGLTEVIAPVREILPAETGPPEARSFVELVLHRSLLSHAPPLLS